LKNTFDVLVIGGGLAGLICANHLFRQNINVAVIEKNTYPNHRVCGEYVSNEVLTYLKFLGVDPFEHNAVKVSKFKISDVNGKILNADLPLGGFGLSRYAFDDLLYKQVKDKVNFLFETVEDIIFSEEVFTVKTKQNNTYKANYVVGAFGKRSNLDINLKRKFIQKKSYWLGIKAHYKFEMPEDEVALHNFQGGYCGLSKTETGAVNACYLVAYKSFKKARNIEDFQKKMMSKNPFLNQFFDQAIPVFDKPITISQISFSEKKCVENHIFMLGDSAGLIHPLCGNGMAMAIHSAKIFSELFIEAKSNNNSRDELEQTYAQEWNSHFKKRLAYGRKIQSLLLNPIATKIGFRIARFFPSILPKIINKTHGKPLV